MLLLVSGCRTEVLHNLSETEANRLITRLHEVRIEGEKTHQDDGTWSVSVPNEDFRLAVRYLSDTRMLHDRRSPVGPSRLLRSREEQRFEYERALSREIEATINSIAGVLESRVHLNLPAPDLLLGRSKGQGSASVLVVVRSGELPDDTRIASLVAGASGLKAAEVAVLFSRGAESPRLFNAGATVPAKDGPGSAYAAPLTRTIWDRLGADQSLWVRILVALLSGGAAFGLYALRKRESKPVVPHSVH